MTDDLATQILASVNSMRAALTDHIASEDNEIQSIKDDLQEWRYAAEHRHAELIKSLESWTSKMDVTSAFLHVEGKPDLMGHKNDHLTRLQFDEWTQKVKQEVFVNTLKVGTVGLMTWLLFIVWKAFIEGPK